MKKIKCEIYTRVVGYFRPVHHWNDGKSAEFNDRLEFDEETTLNSPVAQIKIPQPVQGTIAIVYGADMCSACQELKKRVYEAHLNIDYRDGLKNKEEIKLMGLPLSAALPIMVLDGHVYNEIPVDTFFNLLINHN